jgi:hypothetical protein
MLCQKNLRLKMAEKDLSVPAPGTFSPGFGRRTAILSASGACSPVDPAVLPTVSANTYSGYIRVPRNH